jgi:ATP-dependent Clp protease ATP-binding subunit ClpB
VLLDEFEKADRAVTNMLLQVFDEGSLSDAQGRFIDFKNTIIVLTANIGVGSKTDEAIIDSEKIDKEAVKLLVERYLSPELVNRMDDILVFKQITKDGIEKIRDIQLRKVDELLLKRGIKCELSTAVKSLLSDKSYSDSSGARPLKRLIQVFILYVDINLSLFLECPQVLIAFIFRIRFSIQSRLPSWMAACFLLARCSSTVDLQRQVKKN